MLPCDPTDSPVNNMFLEIQQQKMHDLDVDVRQSVSLTQCCEKEIKIITPIAAASNCWSPFSWVTDNSSIASLFSLSFAEQKKT